MGVAGLKILSSRNLGSLSNYYWYTLEGLVLSRRKREREKNAHLHWIRGDKEESGRGVEGKNRAPGAQHPRMAFSIIEIGMLLHTVREKTALAS